MRTSKILTSLMSVQSIVVLMGVIAFILAITESTNAVSIVLSIAVIVCAVAQIIARYRLNKNNSKTHGL